MSTPSQRIAVEFEDRSTVGLIAQGDDDSRAHWNSTTADASAPTLVTEGKPCRNARKGHIVAQCTGGTSATFALYGHSQEMNVWYLLTDYGTAGSNVVNAGDTEIEDIDLPACLDRIHLQCTAKAGLPTAIKGWIGLGY